MGLFGKDSNSAPVGRKGEVVNLEELPAGDFVSDDDDDDVDLLEGQAEDQGEEIPNPTVDDFLARVQTDGYGGKGSEIATEFLESLVQSFQENPGSTISDLVGQAIKSSKFAADAPRTVDLMALLTTNTLLDSVETESSETINPYDRLRSLVAAIEEKELGVSLI